MPIKDLEVTEILQRTKNLKEHIQSIEGNSVLVVGGGINGVEFATELQESGKYSKVGIITRGPRLLPNLPHTAS